MNEVQLIDKYLKKLTKKNSSSQGLNDDIFFDKSKRLAISIDTYVEKVHFPNFKAPDLVIKKILRSSLSDLICKGVKPKFYFISGSGNKKNFTKEMLGLPNDKFIFCSSIFSKLSFRLPSKYLNVFLIFL